ncbi:MAG TPA: WYL domain-containing protein [Streptosporangiaceae bacterium]|nr:WYL domain-containing protein [Streptosporangiaceae bacterium]
MTQTSARVLRLLSLLQVRRQWPGPDLADRLGVSARTLRRDVERLRDLGYPVHARPGTGGGYELAAGAALPPLGLDEEEAVALIVGLLAALPGGTVGGGTDVSSRVLAKLLPALPQPLARQVQALAAAITPVSREAGAGARPHADAAALLAVAQTCQERARITFGYTVAGGVPTQRHAEPHGLVLLGQCWYLVAWDLDRQDWRSFRVDRMRPPQRAGGHFAPRPVPGPDAAAFVRVSIDALLAR